MSIGGGISESLTLDIGAALASVRRLEDAINQAASASLTVDAAPITRAIDTAVEAADTQVTVTADAAEITGSIDAAVQAANTSVTIEGDTGNLAGDIGEVSGAASSAGLATAALGTSIGRLGSIAKVAVGTVAVGAVVNFAQSAVSAASDLVEAQNLVRVVFEDSAAAVEGFASKAATSVGLAADQALQATASIGGLFIGLGETREEAARLSTELVTLAADLTSAKNIAGGVPEGLNVLRAALVGEIEPIRRLGVAFNAAQVESRALELNVNATTDSLTEAEKVTARYSLIVEQLGRQGVLGDFARTSDQLANSQRILAAEFRETQAAIGTALLPAALEFVRVARGELIPLGAPLADLAGALGSLLVAIVPLASTIVTALAPAIAGLAGGLEGVATGLRPVVSLIDAIPSGAIEAAAALGTVVFATRALQTALASTAAVNMIPFLASLTAALGPIGIGLGVLAAAATVFGDSEAEAAIKVGLFTAALKEQGAAQDLAINAAAIQQFADLDAELLKLVTDAGGLDAALELIRNGQILNNGVIGTESIPAFKDLQAALDGAGVSIFDVADRLDVITAALEGDRIVAEATAGAYESLGDAAAEAVEPLSNIADVLGLQLDAIPKAIKAQDDLAKSTRDLAKDEAEAAKKIADTRADLADTLADIDAGLASSIRDLDLAIADAMQGVVDSFTEKIPQAADAVGSSLDEVRRVIEEQIQAQSKLAQNFRTLGADAADAINLDKTIAELKVQAADIASFFANIQALASKGLDATVGVLLAQGPEAGAALAAALLAGTDEQQSGFDAAVSAFDDTRKQVIGIAEDAARELPSVLEAGGKAAADAFEDEFDLAAPAEASIDDLRAAVVSGLRQAATDARVEAQKVANETVGGIVAGLEAKREEVNAKAAESGRLTGIAYGEGVAQGIVDTLTALDNALPFDLGFSLPGSVTPPPAVAATGGASNVDRGLSSVGNTIIINNPTGETSEESLERVLRRRSLIRTI